MSAGMRRLLLIILTAAGLGFVVLGALGRRADPPLSNIFLFLAAGGCLLLAGSLRRKPAGEEEPEKHSWFWLRVAGMFAAVIALLIYGIWAMINQSL